MPVLQMKKFDLDSFNNLPKVLSSYRVEWEVVFVCFIRADVHIFVHILTNFLPQLSQWHMHEWAQCGEW